MKKLIVILFSIILFTTITALVFAGGDKVRGEKGQGGVNQVQEQDPPPFN